MNNSMRPFVSALPYGVGLMLLILTFGCNSGQVPEGFPQLYSCSLKITQEGEPLAGAIVTLHPQGTALAWAVAGKTDVTGTAIVYTHGHHPGVPAGEYKVTVDKVETVVPPVPEVLPTDEGELAKLNKKLETETKSYRLVEPDYNTVDSTPLSLSVEQKKTKVSFDVGNKYRELAQQKKQKR